MAVKNLVLLCPQFSMVPGCGDYRAGEALKLSRLGDCSILRRSAPLSIPIVAEFVKKNKHNANNSNPNVEHNDRRAYSELSPKLPKLNLNAAGIDIASQSHYVAIGQGCAEQCVREFRSYTSDLYAMASWLEGLWNRDRSDGVDEYILDSRVPGAGKPGIRGDPGQP